MNNDLRAIGDALETAISRDIAGRAHPAVAARPAHDVGTERNTVVVLRHGPVVHNDTAQEAPVLSDIHHDTHSPTDRNTSHQPAGSIGPGRRRRTRRVAIMAGVATLAIGGVAAATAYRLSDDEVSKGLPGGSAIFEGTNPSCTSSDGVVFDCTLESAPTQETQPDYTGNLQTFIDSTSHVAGGCRAISADGLQWTCYAGERAVAEGIIGPLLLGELSLAPARG